AIGSDQAIVRIEQIRRRVNLNGSLIASARSRVAAHAHDSCIREEQCGGVVEARVGGGAAGAEGVGGGIVEVCSLSGGIGTFVVYRTALGEHVAIRQDDRIHLDAARGHVGTGRPTRSAGGQIDHFCRTGGGAAAAEVHHPRSVVGRQQRQDN